LSSYLKAWHRSASTSARFSCDVLRACLTFALAVSFRFLASCAFLLRPVAVTPSFETSTFLNPSISTFGKQISAFALPPSSRPFGDITRREAVPHGGAQLRATQLQNTTHTPQSNPTHLTTTKMSKHATLIKPPKSLPHHSPIESVLSLLPLSDIGPDIYTNARPLWHPPGARGIYGGAAIAQCLSAAQSTVPSDYTVHSMHCYFVLAGNASIPIIYHVERVRDGKSFITRTVQARQRGRPIFTTTISFQRQGSGGAQTVEHGLKIPAGVSVPPEGDQDGLQEGWLGRIERGEGPGRPFESVKVGITPRGNAPPESKKILQWIRARGRISECPPNVRAEEEVRQTRMGEVGEGNHQAHLSALAYMSDSWFIGTVSRVQRLERFASPGHIERAVAEFKGSEAEREEMRKVMEENAKEEEEERAAAAQQGEQLDDGPKVGRGRRIGMMVSLDHTIYFHNPRAFRADEWLLTEMDSPWAGDGRGLVQQRIWTKEGVLVATCYQEGVVRLDQRGREVKL
jgi:acyl-CoA thioesterase